MNTEILYLNDKSGSMSKLRQAVVDGFNRFVDEQRAQPGAARLTHVQFDTVSHLRYSGVPLEQVKPMTLEDYDPEGGTALYDAIGRTLEREGERIAKEGWAELVIVAINTDGEERDSQHYTRAQVNTMITHAQGHGWKFIYLAANVDAFATGAALGIAPQFTRGYTANAAGMADAYGSTSAFTTSMRTAAPTPQAAAWDAAKAQAGNSTPQP